MPTAFEKNALPFAKNALPFAHVDSRYTDTEDLQHFFKPVRVFKSLLRDSL